jgi:choline dehydrogenase-like flavoprotein
LPHEPIPQTIHCDEFLREGIVHSGASTPLSLTSLLLPLTGCFVVLDASTAVADLRRMNIPAWDFLLTSFHPLGTCRMDRDPRRSVVGFDHRARASGGLTGLRQVVSRMVPEGTCVRRRLG